MTFLAEKLNINYADLREELIHFVLSYIVKTTKINVENLPTNFQESKYETNSKNNNSDDSNKINQTHDFSKSSTKVNCEECISCFFKCL